MNKNKIKCKICNKKLKIKGFTGHLATHKISVDEYVKKFGEYRKGKIKNSIRKKNSSVFCLIDNVKCLSEVHLSHYVQKVHGISKKEYVKKYIFNNIPQLCECGCGNEVTILNKPPYRREYISGHNPNGMTGRRHKKTSKKKMSKRAIDRYSSYSKKDTKIELQFEKVLQKLGLQYKKQVKTDYGVVDFKVGDYYIEIDGEYWHPLKLQDLNFQLIRSSINDFRKNKNLNNLIRIRGDNLNNDFKSFVDILNVNCKDLYPDKVVDYRYPIIKNEYFKYIIDSYGKDYLEKNATLLLDFIRTFHPTLPKFQHNETLSKTLNTIPTKIDSIYTDGVFNNNCSTSGVGYLKSNFKSYWKSKYKGNKSPEEIWNDDELMLKIIKYRIGVNNSNEIFDFSLHQLIRGISAIRGTISFFKPVLAAAIYKQYISNKKVPVVLDPCAGFGGRLLGFKSIFPDGKYIGCEPNVETFNELKKLLQNFANVEVYNCKFEDFKQYEKYDLVFTSIPYYDLEEYSNVVKYKNFNDWECTFLSEFYKYENVLLNIPNTLKSSFENCKIKSYIEHNSSHLCSSKKKKELIIEI